VARVKGATGVAARSAGPTRDSVRSVLRSGSYEDDAQADSAGSIPVTRSNVKTRAKGSYRLLSLRSLKIETASSAINVPLKVLSADCQLI
jgi:hypothetical protein